MPISATVAIDASQFPENVQRDLLDSLRTRHIQPKFLYDSYKQARQWLAIHEAYSPARRDPECLAIYDQACVATAGLVYACGASVVGLGCGGGQKDAALLRALVERDVVVSYVPCDVSVALVLAAQQAAVAAVPGLCVNPLVLDLARCGDLAHTIGHAGKAGIPNRRIFTFFGMLPNFESQVILPRLAELLRKDDLLLLSANLAPGPDYAAGVQCVLSGYDNPLTREWLLTVLLDLGIDLGDGDIRFSIEDAPDGLKRIVADFHFARSRELVVSNERFVFKAGETIRLFYSYRHTVPLAHSLLASHGFAILGEWVAASGEEGVFLCRRQ